MKKILVSVLIAVLCATASYLLGGFIDWEWDASKWDGFSRMMLTLVSIFLSVSLIMLYLSEQEKK